MCRHKKLSTYLTEDVFYFCSIFPFLHKFSFQVLALVAYSVCKGWYSSQRIVRASKKWNLYKLSKRFYKLFFPIFISSQKLWHQKYVQNFKNLAHVKIIIDVVNFNTLFHVIMTNLLPTLSPFCFIKYGQRFTLKLSFRRHSS